MASNDWSPGVQFRWWRERVGLTAREAGEALGKSQQTVSAWESEVAQTLPTWRVAPLIDSVYELTPGMALAVIEGQSPPPGLSEPRAVDLDKNGELVWSARYLLRDVPAQRRFSAVS